MIFNWSSPIRFFRALWNSLVFLAAGGPVITPKSIQRYRNAKCVACPHYKGFQCDLCACLVVVKTRLSAECCPDTPPRWDALTAETDEDASE